MSIYLYTKYEQIWSRYDLTHGVYWHRMTQYYFTSSFNKYDQLNAQKIKIINMTLDPTDKTENLE